MLAGSFLAITLALVGFYRKEALMSEIIRAAHLELEDESGLAMIRFSDGSLSVGFHDPDVMERIIAEALGAKKLVAAEIDPLREQAFEYFLSYGERMLNKFLNGVTRRAGREPIRPLSPPTAFPVYSPDAIGLG